MKFLREHPHWTLVMVALVIAGGVYTVRVIQAEPNPPPEVGAGPQVKGRLMDIIIGEESGTTFCEYDAVVELKGDGTVVAKIPMPMAEGLPVAPGERVEDYKPLADNSTTTVHRGQDGKLHEGCAPESVRIPLPPLSAGPPAPPAAATP